jgi:uncharacterized protein YdeI (YjbR/CyaY-like superfamily)
MARPAASEMPILQFETQAALEAWLEENHATSQGILLKLAKKESGIPSVTYPEVVEAVLCFGWIDGQGKSGQKAGLGDAYWLLKITPRRKQSIWSKRNREKVDELIRAGRMRPAGLEEIERAKADGRWDRAYDSPRTITVPEDFQAALQQNPKAQAFFESLNSANRYAILFRIQAAKKPETRARRIENFIRMLENEEKLYP